MRSASSSVPQVDGEYVARMEDVLDLYAEDPDRIKWMLTTAKARAKTGRAYPSAGGPQNALGQ